MSPARSRVLLLCAVACLALTLVSASSPTRSKRVPTKLKLTMEDREEIVSAGRALARPFVNGFLALYEEIKELRQHQLASKANQHGSSPRSTHQHAPTAPAVSPLFSAFSDEQLHHIHGLLNKQLGRSGAVAPSTTVGRAQSIQCSICELVVSAVEPVLESNISLAIIEPIAIDVCKLIKPECTDPRSCDDLCKGVIAEFTPDILRVVLGGVLDPARLCYLIKLCDEPAPPTPPPHYVPQPSNCSDHSGERDWPSWKLTTGTGYFIQMSDIHVDLKYTVGANSICGEPLCCRTFDGMAPNDTGAAYYGDYNCDTPLPTVDSLFYLISTLDPAPDFILYTGDDPPHDIWEQSRDSNLLAINTLSEYMQKYFSDIPVFSALGNHESFPVNQYEGPGPDSWLYNGVASAWSPWLCDDGLKTLKFGGYYSCRVRPGLRVISLNTNLWMTGNYWLNANLSDFGHQLDWLNDTLHQAEQLQEKVIIIGHAISQDWFDDFGFPYAALVERFQHTIVTQFFGHSHTSSYQMFYDNATNTIPISMGFIGGSVTPYTSLNPVFRRYFYDRAALARVTSAKARDDVADDDDEEVAVEDNAYTLVEDVEAFWLDLAETRASNQTDWLSHSYRYTTAYNLSTPLTWQVMSDMGHRLLTDPPLFQVYMNHYYRNVTQSQPDQLHGVVCEILAFTNAGYSECLNQHGVTGVRRPKSRC